LLFSTEAVKMLDQFTYIFAIGTFFALLDAYNNGASKFLLLSSLISSEFFFLGGRGSSSPGPQQQRKNPTFFRVLESLEISSFSQTSSGH